MRMSNADQDGALLSHLFFEGVPGLRRGIGSLCQAARSRWTPRTFLPAQNLRTVQVVGLAQWPSLVSAMAAASAISRVSTAETQVFRGAWDTCPPPSARPSDETSFW